MPTEENLVRKAIELVAEGETKKAIEVLLASLANPDWSIRSYSAQILGELGKISLSEELFTTTIQSMSMHLINETDGWVRESITKAFGKIGANNPQLVKDIIPNIVSVLIKDEHEGARGSAAKSLGDIGRKSPDLILPGSTLDYLAQRLKSDESWIVRYYSAYALGEIGTQVPDEIEKYIEILEAATNDDDDGVKNAAKEALGKIKKSK
ncbi:MAG: HEAT repeat domain-containing protein [Candidatus Helarchaeota archaeon]|nr:HEAT repeat domain-containing protein [Candidatus Helarchaeota archaeon]